MSRCTSCQAKIDANEHHFSPKGRGPLCESCYDIPLLDEIEPCRFCGSIDFLDIGETSMLSGHKRFAVHCGNCDARGPSESAPEAAVAAWNPRRGE
jgi:Lar family restriction alleviation protein